MHKFSAPNRWTWVVKSALSFVVRPVVTAIVLLVVVLGFELNAVVNCGLSMNEAWKDSLQLTLYWPLVALGLVVLKGWLRLWGWGTNKGAVLAQDVVDRGF
jgi:hypothetical protein